MGRKQIGSMVTEHFHWKKNLSGTSMALYSEGHIRRTQDCRTIFSVMGIIVRWSFLCLKLVGF